MSGRDDRQVDVPYFGSANQDEPENNIVEKQQELARKQYENQGGNWMHSIILIAITIAVSALGYWGMDLNTLQKEQAQQVVKAEARIAELEQLLAAAKEQSEKSGQTLEQKLNEQKTAMDAQYKVYEKQFFELIQSADKQQKQQLALFNTEIAKVELKIKSAQEDAQEEIGFMTKQQKASLLGLEERLTEITDLRTNLTTVEINQKNNTVSQQKITADITSILSDIEALNKKSKRDTHAVAKEVTALEKSIDQYKAAQHKSMGALTKKVTVLAKKAAPKLDVAVTNRLVKVEQAITAIDGTRLQVNKDIQRLKNRVNKIQLQLQ